MTLPAPTGASPCEAGTGVQNLKVVPLGAGLVAVGSCGHSTGPTFSWVSADGVSWTGSAPAALATADVYQVISEGDLVVAVGQDVRNGAEAASWTSRDGTNWTRSTSDLGTGVIETVTAFDSGFLAFGNRMPSIVEWPGPSGVLEWTSTDGVSWSTVPVSKSLFPDSAVVGDLAAGVHGLIAVGSEAGATQTSAVVWHSSDGRLWTRLGAIPGAAGSSLNEAVARADGFVIGGLGPNGQERIWASTDGATWRDAASPGQSGFYGGPTLVAGSTALAFGGYADVTSDVPGMVWTSDSGLVWQTTPALPTDVRPVSIAWAGDLLLVAATTPDGRAAILSLRP